MADPFTGEIRAFGFNFAPRDWAMCNGAQIAIQQNPALYSILGNTFGGTQNSTFAIPNLQGQAPMHWGTGAGLTQRAYGRSIGAENVTLMATQMPAHGHAVTGGTVNASGQTAAPNADSVFGRVGTPTIGMRAYSKDDHSDATMGQQMIGGVGGNQGHENRQPFLSLNFCICLYGDYPVRPD